MSHGSFHVRSSPLCLSTHALAHDGMGSSSWASVARRAIGSFHPALCGRLVPLREFHGTGVDRSHCNRDGSIEASEIFAH